VELEFVLPGAAEKQHCGNNILRSIKQEDEEENSKTIDDDE
jgi:hypothetical protein